MEKYKVSERTAILLDAVAMSQKLSEVAQTGAEAYGEEYAEAASGKLYEVWKPLNDLLENRLLASIVDNIVENEGVI